MVAPSLWLVAALALSATTLATPLNHRDFASNHAALAARIAAPVPAPVADGLFEPLPKRSGRRSKRCQAPIAHSPTTTHTTSTTKHAGSTPPPVNVEDNPPPPPPAPKPTTTHQAAPPPPPPSPKPAPTTPALQPPPPGVCAGPTALSGSYSGDGTFYATGLGACGIVNHDTDFIVAVAHDFYDNFPDYNFAAGNPNNNPICGKKIQASYGGNTVTVTVTDRCGGCSCQDLDFSPAAFNTLANPAIGRIHGVKWHFI